MKPSALLVIIILAVSLSSQAFAAAPAPPSFHQVYGVVNPSTVTGSISIKVGSSQSSYPIVSGRFGQSDLIKLQGQDGDLVTVSFNGTNISIFTFRPRGYNLVTVNLASSQAAQSRTTVFGDLPSGVTEQAFIDDAAISNRSIAGMRTLTLAKPGQPATVTARIDLDSGSINLSRVRISTSSSGRGGSSITGLVLPQGSTKAMRFPRVGSGQYVCVKDSDGADHSNISARCDAQGEVKLFCDGVYNFGFRCTIEGNNYLIEGLRHSAAAEILPSDESAQASSSAQTGSQSSSSLIDEAGSSNQSVEEGSKIKRFKINISSSPQSFDLGQRDSVEFMISDSKIVITHLSNGMSNASFKSYPSGRIFDLRKGNAEVLDLNLDAKTEVALTLTETSGSSATLELYLTDAQPTPVPAQVVAQQPAVQAPQQQYQPTQQYPSLPGQQVSTPQIPAASPTPIKTPPSVEVPAMVQTQQVTPLAGAKEEPIPVVESPSDLDERSGIMASAVAITEAYPWAIPTLGIVLLFVFAILAYAVYLLYKELQAVKEITLYVNQTLTQGFTLPQIIAALRQNKWSEAHISKSLQKVASGYVEVSVKQGKPAQTIRDELSVRAWPPEIIDKVLFGKR